MGCGGSKKQDLQNKRSFRPDSDEEEISKDIDSYPKSGTVPIEKSPHVPSSGGASRLSQSYTDRQIEEREVFLKNIENQLIYVDPQKPEIWGNSEQVQMEYKQIRNFKESSQIFGLPNASKIKASEIPLKLSQYTITAEDVHLIEDVISRMKDAKLHFSDKCMRGLVVNLFEE